MLIAPKITLLVLSLGLVFLAAMAGVRALDLRGSWQPRIYMLKDGTLHTVDGLLFFSQKDWTVIFFIVEDGRPVSGSAEGGTYTLENDQLLFTHIYNFASPEGQEPRMTIRGRQEALNEACTVQLEGDRLTISFPSGNSMVLRRSSI